MRKASPATRPNGFLRRVALYLRRSAEEATDNYSIETQERACREKADRVFGRDGYVLVGTFADPGRSGRLGLARPGLPDRRCRQGLTDLIALIDDGQVNAVVVYKLDRLARRMRLLLELLDDHFVPHGVDLYSAGEDLDIVSAQGRFTVQLLGSVAEWYSSQAAERTRDGLRNRRAQGFAHGCPPYGWRKQTPEEANGGRRSLARVPEEGRWLVHMKERVLSGWGAVRVANELMQLGVPTKTGQSRWWPLAVYGVLLNPIHAGLIMVEGELHEGNFARERYWDKETLEQLRAEIARHRRIPQASQAATRYLLLEVLRCEGCGKRLYGQQVKHASGLVPHYWCHTRPARPGCHRSVISAPVLESAVIEELRRIAQSEELQALAEEAVQELLDSHAEDLQCRCRQLSQQQARLETQLDRWADQLTTGHVTQAQFDRFHEQLWGRLERCTAELAEAQQALAQRGLRRARLAEVRATLRDFDTIWGSLDAEQRRHLVGSLIERLTLEWRGRDSVLRLTPVGLPMREIIVQSRRYRSADRPGGAEARLTSRHLAVLHLLDQGLTTREVARRLGIGLGTVTTYLAVARRASGLKDRSQLLAWARPIIQPRLATLRLTPQPKKVSSRTLLEPNQMVRGALQRHAERGASVAAIAREGGLKYGNLRAQLWGWCQRLDVQGIDELVKEAQRRGWIPAAGTPEEGGSHGDA